MNHKRITEYKLTRLFISFIIMWILGFLFFRYNWNCNVNWSMTHRCTIFKKGEHFPLYIMYIPISTTKTAAHRSEWKKLFSYTKIWIWRLETRQDIVLLKEYNFFRCMFVCDCVCVSMFLVMEKFKNFIQNFTIYIFKLIMYIPKFQFLAPNNLIQIMKYANSINMLLCFLLFLICFFYKYQFMFIFYVYLLWF